MNAPGLPDGTCSVCRKRRMVWFVGRPFGAVQCRECWDEDVHGPVPTGVT